MQDAPAKIQNSRQKLVHPSLCEGAYRGELREGDHVEYTLMDKKNRHRPLDECWLFATLEPCSPGSRNAPKIPCSERIVNARIVKVWFGEEDLALKDDFGGVAFLKKNHIEVGL
jgi:ATP-dependent DNA helicase RecG